LQLLMQLRKLTQSMSLPQAVPCAQQEPVMHESQVGSPVPIPPHIPPLLAAPAISVELLGPGPGAVPCAMSAIETPGGVPPRPLPQPTPTTSEIERPEMTRSGSAWKVFMHVP
jgi:hypothetical protein